MQVSFLFELLFFCSFYLVASSCVMLSIRYYASLPMMDRSVQDIQVAAKDLPECTICMNAKAGFFFTSCGHLCVCSLCRLQLPDEVCPICKQVGPTEVLRLPFRGAVKTHSFMITSKERKPYQRPYWEHVEPEPERDNVSVDVALDDFPDWPDWLNDVVGDEEEGEVLIPSNM